MFSPFIYHVPFDNIKNACNHKCRDTHNHVSRTWSSHFLIACSSKESRFASMEFSFLKPHHHCLHFMIVNKNHYGLNWYQMWTLPWHITVDVQWCRNQSIRNQSQSVKCPFEPKNENFLFKQVSVRWCWLVRTSYHFFLKPHPCLEVIYVWVLLNVKIAINKAYDVWDEP